MEMGKQTSWMKNKSSFSNNATLHCMIIGKRQTNQLDKKGTNYKKALHDKWKWANKLVG